MVLFNKNINMIKSAKALRISLAVTHAFILLKNKNILSRPVCENNGELK